MTNDEKLAILAEYEKEAWKGLARATSVAGIESLDLKNIERCHRIRAYLPRVPIEY